jgi:hypothetical protein
MDIHEFEPSQESVNQYLHALNYSLGVHYGLPDLLADDSDMVVGYRRSDSLEPVLERSSSIRRVDDVNAYSLNTADLSEFDDEISAMFGEKAHDPEIATKLFVGLGVAGSAALELLSRTSKEVDSTKEKSHFKMVAEFFNSANDIHNTFKDVFMELLEPNGQASPKLGMTEKIPGERAAAINGLRFRFLVLMNVPDVVEWTGVDYRQFVELARQEIGYHRTIVRNLGHNEKRADRLFFDNLPDWLIAAATPVRDAQVQRIFSQAWQR